MKNQYVGKRKGFTLIELLVVVLIISVLAAIALPAYFRSVERTRISEAEIMMGMVVQAQQRYKLSRGKGYADNWKALDAAPDGVADNNSMLDNRTFCTKGKSGTGENVTCKNGFSIALVGTSSTPGNNSGVIATRTGNNQYGEYQLARFYDTHTIPGFVEVICHGKGNPHAEDLCLDFMTTDTYTEPTADQMPSVPTQNP